MYRCTAVYRSAAAIAHGFWAHIRSPPRIDKPPFSRWGGDRLELLVTFVVCCRTASDSSTAAWLNPLSLGLKIDQSQKDVQLGLNRLRLPRHQHPAQRPTRLTCTRAVVMRSI